MFTRESPSAPASATARASSAMSALAGESFAYSGLSVAARAACTSSAIVSGASSTLGHERFNSTTSIASSSSMRSQQTR